MIQGYRVIINNLDFPVTQILLLQTIFSCPFICIYFLIWTVAPTLLSYLFAFLVSFGGNFSLTFSDSTQRAHWLSSFIKWFVSSIMGLPVYMGSIKALMNLKTYGNTGLKHVTLTSIIPT